MSPIRVSELVLVLCLFYWAKAPRCEFPTPQSPFWESKNLSLAVYSLVFYQKRQKLHDLLCLLTRPLSWQNGTRSNCSASGLSCQARKDNLPLLSAVLYQILGSAALLFAAMTWESVWSRGFNCWSGALVTLWCLCVWASERKREAEVC